MKSRRLDILSGLRGSKSWAGKAAYQYGQCGEQIAIRIGDAVPTAVVIRTSKKTETSSMINPVIMFSIAAKIMLGRKRIEASRGESACTFCQLTRASISGFDYWREEVVGVQLTKDCRTAP